MLKRQNDLHQLFCKLVRSLIFAIFCYPISRFIFVTFGYLANQNVAFSVVSSQQCDRELAKHCPSAVYSSTEERIKCVKEKQSHFSYECVVRILGLETHEGEEIDIDNKLPSVLDQTIKQRYIENKQHETEDSDQIIKRQQQKISALIENILRNRCSGDMAFLCKTRVKKGNLIIMESLESCINKMIKNNFRLSFGCYGAIQDILSDQTDPRNAHHNLFMMKVNQKMRIKQLSKKNKDYLK